MRAAALAVLLSLASACGRGLAIYAGSDVTAAGSGAVVREEPVAGSVAEPPVEPRADEPFLDSGSIDVRDAAVSRDAGPVEGDAGADAASDAAAPDAGAACAAGRADCDGDSANGCEVDLQSSLQHCGACERSCHADGAGVSSAVCVEGSCELACQYAPIRGDCDGDPDNGCEIDLWHDPENCSVCGMRCNRCADGVCR